MIFLIVILLYPLIVGVSLLVLNDQCLLPGTVNYRCKQIERQSALQTEQARAQAIRQRYLATEDSYLEKRLPQLEAAKSQETVAV